mmetsp:Transcript_109106/g.295726  ORF Transcript_109106/g.295726 Transcript_109106/m.295726 type:complete len:747 (-) Transcript_109106:76-2316(-)
MARPRPRAHAARAPLLLVAVALPALASGSGFRFAANPVRRVVQMLQMLQQKADEEFAKEEGLFSKAMCQCSSTIGALRQSAADATEKLPQLDSAIKGGRAEQAELQSDIAHARAERADSETTLGEARETRKREAAAHEKAAATTAAHVKNLNDAVASLSSAGTSALLQDRAQVASLQRVVAAQDSIVKDDRDAVIAFLQGGEQSGGSSLDEVLGIMRQLAESMAKDLEDMNQADQEAQQAFENIEAAKLGQIATTDSVVKEKSTRLGELSLSIVNDVEDREETAAILEENVKILQETQKNCEQNKAEWSLRVNFHKEESVAIADAIRLLNEQATQAVLSKSVPVPPAPVPSFLQLRGAAGAEEAPCRTQELLGQAARGGDARLSLLAVSSRVRLRAGSRLRARQMGFEKVIQMVTGMVEQLQEEQAAEDKKRAYCQRSLEEADDERRGLENLISDHQKETDEGAEQLTVLAEEVAALQKGLEALDAQVQEATAQRKAENEDYVNALSEQVAAKEVLIMARMRLEQFYGQRAQLIQANATADAGAAQARSPGAAEGGAESASDVALEAFGAAPVFAQLAARGGGGPEQPIANAWTLKLGPFANKGGPGDVLALIDTLVRELDEDTEAMKKREKEAQQEYEIAQGLASEKRETDIKAIASREAVRVKLEEKMHHWKLGIKAKQKDLGDHTEYTVELHKECDGLLKDFELLRRVRSDEVASLRSAKAILADADASLVQTPRGARSSPGG